MTSPVPTRLAAIAGTVGSGPNPVNQFGIFTFG